MFRHLFHLNPSVFIEERTLAEIASGDMPMLDAERQKVSQQHAAAEWTAAILGAAASARARRATPDGRGFNKMLDNRSRIAYADALAELKTCAPDMIARKIERANIQQAFALDTAHRFLADCPNARILAAGSFEDTAVATLRAQGFHIEEVDPNVNGMTLTDFYVSPKARLGSYDLVLSVSVLEHVEDDLQFVRIISEFLRPGGLAVLTVDFAEGWRPGKKKPEVDHRLYTTKEITTWLMRGIGDCALIDPPTWREGEEDFEYEGSRYGFAGFVFRKLDPESIALAATPPVWKEMLVGAIKGVKAPYRQRDKMITTTTSIYNLLTTKAARKKLKWKLRAAFSELKKNKWPMVGATKGVKARPTGGDKMTAIKRLFSKK